MDTSQPMVVHGKWLSDTSPDMPVSDVARMAITNRLATLWHYLPRAAECPEEDIEYIHQLRVWSRRSAAALQTFESLLPKKSVRWISQELKRVRRAAGDARDYDVFIERMSAGSDQLDAAVASTLLEDLRARRQAAQPAVVEVYEDLRLWQFELRVELLAERVRRRGEFLESDFGTAAREVFRPIVAEFHEARQADFASTESLHQLRICGKKLRYAMELLAGAFHKAFRKELYPTVGQMQDKLGVLNDHATACARLSQWLAETEDPAMAAVYAKLADREAAAIEVSADEFRNWWTPAWADEFEGQLREMIDQEPA